MKYRKNIIQKNKEIVVNEVFELLKTGDKSINVTKVEGKPLSLRFSTDFHTVIMTIEIENEVVIEEVPICPEWIHKERRKQNEDNFCPICGTDIR